MDVKKTLLDKAHSVAFFIHRSRVQRLYRNFLRVCQDNEERLQVREEFRKGNQLTQVNLKEAEAILKRLQLARGLEHSKPVPVVGRSPLKKQQMNKQDQSVPNEILAAAEAYQDSKKDSEVEWPWQRRS